MNPVPWLQMTNMISYQGLVRTFPKSSSEAQYIEGRQNLLKMMQEIPLTDDEQAAVNNDIGAIDKLLEKLKNIETPDKQRR